MCSSFSFTQHLLTRRAGFELDGVQKYGGRSRPPVPLHRHQLSGEPAIQSDRRHVHTRAAGRLLPRMYN